MESLYDKLRPKSPQYGLGALSQALQPFEEALSERKQKREQQEQLKTMAEGFVAAGYSPEEAKALVSMTDQDRQYVLKGLANRGFGGGLENNTGLGSLLQQMPQGLEMLQGISGNGSPQNQNPFYQAGMQQQSFGENQFPQQSPMNIRQALSLPTKAEQRENEKVAIQRDKLNTQKEQFERKFGQQEQKEINQETKKYYDEVLNQYKSAQENNKRLGRMKEINEKGDLGSPTKNQFIKLMTEGILGPHGPKIDIQRWLTGDAQEFEKLTNDFLKDAKTIFGSRLTNYDVETFLKTVPTIYQSYEGRQRIIHNLENYNKGQEARFNAGKDIIKENKGKRPANFELLVEERVKDELDKLAEEFKKGYQIKVTPIPGAKFTAP